VAGAGVGVTFKFAVGSVMRIAPESSLLGLVLQAVPLAPSAVLFGAGMLVLLATAAVASRRTRLAAAGEQPAPAFA
jgi:hypothetical protein